MASSNEDKISSFKESLRNGEYEAQLFETASYCLFQEIKELTLNDIRKTTNKLQEKLVSKCGTPDEVLNSESLIQQLRAKYEASVHTFFKDLEVTVKKIFCIPPHILLAEDAIQSKQFTEEDLQKIDREIETLTSRYRRAVCMESLLKKEKKTASCIDIIERKTLEVEDNINVLDNICQRNMHGLTFLSDELDELLKLLNRVHPFSLTEDTNNVEYLKDKLSLRIE